MLALGCEGVCEVFLHGCGGGKGRGLGCLYISALTQRPSSEIVESRPLLSLARSICLRLPYRADLAVRIGRCEPSIRNRNNATDSRVCRESSSDPPSGAHTPAERQTLLVVAHDELARRPVVAPAARRALRRQRPRLRRHRQCPRPFQYTTAQV